MIWRLPVGKPRRRKRILLRPLSAAAAAGNEEFPGFDKQKQKVKKSKKTEEQCKNCTF